MSTQPLPPRNVAGSGFCLRATRHIETPRRVIAPGQLLYIAPSIPPAPGRMVVVGHCLELWAGQADVRGVLAAVFTAEDDRNEGDQS